MDRVVDMSTIAVTVLNLVIVCCIVKNLQLTEREHSKLKKTTITTERTISVNDRKVATIINLQMAIIVNLINSSCRGCRCRIQCEGGFLLLF